MRLIFRHSDCNVWLLRGADCRLGALWLALREPTRIDTKATCSRRVATYDSFLTVTSQICAFLPLESSPNFSPRKKTKDNRIKIR